MFYSSCGVRDFGWVAWAVVGWVGIVFGWEDVLCDEGVDDGSSVWMVGGVNCVSSAVARIWVGEGFSYVTNIVSRRSPILGDKRKSEFMRVYGWLIEMPM